MNHFGYSHMAPRFNHYQQRTGGSDDTTTYITSVKGSQHASRARDRSGQDEEGDADNGQAYRARKITNSWGDRNRPNTLFMGNHRRRVGTKGYLIVCF